MRIVTNDSETLRQMLRRMPTPEAPSGLVDRVLARATGRDRQAERTREARRGLLRHLATRWETWIGAALGGAVAAAVTLILLHPIDRPVPQSGTQHEVIALSLHEVRAVDVVIDSERDLEGATIRVSAIGSVALDGFEGQHEINWQTRLERGTNLLSLPVVARTAGSGQLIAIIEHEGRTRRIALDVTVHNPGVSRS